MSELTNRSDKLPDNYDPEKGLRKVAVAEAGEKYYARAKDATKLYEAVEGKLGEQRFFIIWFDREFHGDEVKSGGNRQVSELTLEEIPHKQTRKRWRKLKDPNAFGKRLEEAQIRCRKICEAEQAANYSSESIEWYTPEQYLDGAHEVMGGIDLDPASNDFANETVRAKAFYTKNDDGLRQSWGGRVFLNPPYGIESGDSVAGLFCSKAIKEYEGGNVSEAILLVNLSPSQNWQAPLYDYTLCLVDHRIQFVSGDGEKNKNPTHQNLFVYMGSNVERFSAVFSRFGYVVGKC